MIDIGTVEDIINLPVGLVVAIRLTDQDCPIGIGVAMRLGGGSPVILQGLKFWPRKGTLDALFASGTPAPMIGDSVALVSPE